MEHPCIYINQHKEIIIGLFVKRYIFYVTSCELVNLQAECITHKLVTQDGSPPPFHLVAYWMTFQLSSIFMFLFLF